MDTALIAAGAGVGFLVGLTGMGGGALMTPLLVLFFGVNPLAAVSSDLIVSAIMKPVGSAVHAKQGTVYWKLVGLLCAGSIPATLLALAVLTTLRESDSLQTIVKALLATALLIAAGSMVLKDIVSSRKTDLNTNTPDSLSLRPISTVLLGVVGGLMVGLTSVGSGSLILVGLLMIYPALTANRLVGTDLAQAVPLVAVAAIGHAILGDADFTLVWPLVLGGVPAVVVGALVSSKAPKTLVRRILIVVLILTGLKMSLDLF